MAEELKDLIEKIHQEGVKAAEDKASDIENEAKRRAEIIIEKAGKEAENIIAEAKEKSAKMEKTGKLSLKQAGRDTILSLRKEINAVLDKIVVSHVREALNPGELSKIISALIKNCDGMEKNSIMISLNKGNLEKLKKGFLSKLKDETKKEIILKSSEDIHGGFTISYDSGKSHYDFTDEALAGYISLYLKPELSGMLKETQKFD
ncbi:MAG: V-type ATP synthase subunit E family protein [Candidatus Omnitrophota bacterium]|nr:V-type ATP synthase subunit E family protein [Candidatus Omnitrophota bacterium]